MKRNLFRALLSVVLLLALSVGLLFAHPVAVSADETDSDEPLLRVAMLADLHVEFGLQEMLSPIRPSTKEVVKDIQNRTGGAGVDIALVGGDMTGGRGDWSLDQIYRTKESIYDYVSGATKDGKVLFVTGNHDPEPSVKAGDNTEFYSGDYSSFLQEGCGEFAASFWVDEISPSLSPYGELLCYRYSIGGVEFLGINTPYVENQAKVCGFYAQQTLWLQEQLAQIGPDRTAVLLCHYPVSAIQTIQDPVTYASRNTCRSDMTAILKEYPNLIYCYGHVHSGTEWMAKTAATDIVRPQNMVTRLDSGVFETHGYINAHMGSLGYYNNEYQPGGLTSADPAVVQYVLADFYANRIVFRVINVGEKVAPGGTEEILPLTVVRDLSVQFGLDPSRGVYQLPSDEVPESSGAPGLILWIALPLAAVAFGISLFLYKKGLWPRPREGSRKTV